MGPIQSPGCLGPPESGHSLDTLSPAPRFAPAAAFVVRADLVSLRPRLLPFVMFRSHHFTRLCSFRKGDPNRSLTLMRAGQRAMAARKIGGIAHVVSRLTTCRKSLPAESSTRRMLSTERRNSPAKVSLTIWPVGSTDAWPETKIRSHPRTAGLNGRCEVGVLVSRGIGDGSPHRVCVANSVPGSSGQTGRCNRRHGKLARLLEHGPGVSTKCEARAMGS